MCEDWSKEVKVRDENRICILLTLEDLKVLTEIVVISAKKDMNWRDGSN
jgi:hypothetical protein